jgi:hypothetical protein
MKSGYNISWTPNTLNELEETIKYLQKTFQIKKSLSLPIKSKVSRKSFLKIHMFFQSLNIQTFTKRLFLLLIPHIIVLKTTM